jgi:endonuclease-8
VPEGDTIHKIARFLAPRLTGQTVQRISLPDTAAARRCRGRRVDAVVVRGKHLFIEFDNDLAIRSHLGMHGSWHAYPLAEPWQRPRTQLSMSLATADSEFVCFNAREVEILKLRGVRNRIVHTRLGPDLVSDSIDSADLVRRARDLLAGDTLLIDTLLDQRVACGIGNVYKSEVLFVERLSPYGLLAEIDDEGLGQCFARAASLLRSNLGGGGRVTRFENHAAGSLWVYGRSGLPCLSCATPIRYRRLGRHQRATYWCPSCQAG